MYMYMHTYMHTFRRRPDAAGGRRSPRDRGAAETKPMKSEPPTPARSPDNQLILIQKELREQRIHV